MNVSFSTLMPNQGALKVDNFIYFISYDQIICKYNDDNGELLLYSGLWDCSNTTRKYFKAFINSYTRYEYKSKQDFLKEFVTNSSRPDIKSVS